MVTSKDGTTLAVDRVGSGPAVVCVGGALNDRHSTAGVAAALQGFTAYSYDRRGRGDSGDTPPYTPDKEIEDLAAVIEHAGGEAMVYGMSSGAVLALQAAQAGLPITKLALYEPPFTGNVPPDYATNLAAADPDEALELFLTLVGFPRQAIQGMRHAPHWPAMAVLAPTLRYDAAIMGDATIPDVATMTTPTTVLIGGASPAFLQQAGRNLADALPNGTTRVLDDQTHDVDPTALAEALTRIFTDK
jgi:pimeloyl-ACP methyl ester carboxylesterase